MSCSRSRSGPAPLGGGPSSGIACEPPSGDVPEDRGQQPDADRSGPRRVSCFVAVPRMLRRFARCERGAIAVEFALVLPVLLALLLGAADVSWLVYAEHKTTRIAMSLADLTARAEELSPTDITDLFAAVARVAEPFDIVADGRAVVTSVTNPNGTGARIAWQRANGRRSATSRIGAPGATADLGGDITVRQGETIVVGEIFLRFRPLVGFVLDEREIYLRLYQRPRFGTVTLTTGG